MIRVGKDVVSLYVYHDELMYHIQVGVEPSTYLNLLGENPLSSFITEAEDGDCKLLTSAPGEVQPKLVILNMNPKHDEGESKELSNVSILGHWTAHALMSTFGTVFMPSQRPHAPITAPLQCLAITCAEDHVPACH